MKESIVRKRRALKLVKNDIDRCYRTLDELKKEKYQHELGVARTVLELYRCRTELAYQEGQLDELNKET